METKKNYKQICEELAKLQEKKDLFDRLHEIGGISYKQVHLFHFPHCKSGFSMGETVVLYVNHKAVAEQNQCLQYAKSCTWQEKHGLLRFDFTKKDFKKLFELLEKVEYDLYMVGHAKDEYRLKYEKRFLNDSNEITEMWKKAFKEDHSKFKCQRVENVTIV